MGLFDKKKSAEQNPPTAAEPATKAVAPEAVALTPSAASSRGPEPAYGIRQAIDLMRGLPGDNVDLVVHVVKKTLESMGVRIEAIIEDAASTQADVETRIAVMREEIGELDQEIQLRREEIGRLDAECREVILVKERLLLALRLGTAPAPVARPAAGRSDGRPEARPEPQAVSQPVRAEARPARSDATPLDLPVVTIEKPPEPRPRVAPPPHTTGSHALTRPLPGVAPTPKK